jgi:hypothetical protein
METVDEERVPVILEVLEDRARVLADQDRMGRVVVHAELIADAVAFAEPV